MCIAPMSMPAIAAVVSGAAAWPCMCICADAGAATRSAASAIPRISIMLVLHGGRRARRRPEPGHVRPQRVDVPLLQVVLERRHAHRRMLEERPRDRVRLEAARDAALDPLAELGAVLHELREVAAVPRRDDALPRAGIRAREPAARPVAARAAERLRALEPV